MEYLATWMTNIVLFILLAIVIDLLLPNSSMQNYAKMVIGLLLILLLLTPVLRFFSEDFERTLRNIEIGGFTENEQLKNRLELKKKEIQANQQAYVLEKTAVQLKDTVQKELVAQYGYTIKSIDLMLAEDAGQNWTTVDLQQLNVIVSHTSHVEGEEKFVEGIAPVEVYVATIEMGVKKEVVEPKQFTEIQRFLASQWGVEEEKIMIQGD